MCYIEFVADRLLIVLGGIRAFHCDPPFLIGWSDFITRESGLLDSSDLRLCCSMLTFESVNQSLDNVSLPVACSNHTWSKFQPEYGKRELAHVACSNHMWS